MKNGVVDLEAMTKIVASQKGSNKYYLDKEKIFWAMFYTMPTFHNPTGMSLSAGNVMKTLQSVHFIVLIFIL